MEFHDMSTTTGRMKQLISRLNWRWFLAGLLIATFITIWVATVENENENTSQPAAELLSLSLHSHSNSNVEPSNNKNNLNLLKASSSSSSSSSSSLASISNQITDTVPDKSIRSRSRSSSQPGSGSGKAPKTKKPGTFFFYGDGSSYLTDLESAWLNKSAVLGLEIHNYVIDAGSLSRSLEDVINLESINVVAPKLTGQFSRVYLPQLRQFSFSLDVDVDVEPYKDPGFLNSLLFFDTVRDDPDTDTDVDLDLISHLAQLHSAGVNVHVAAGHQTILDIRPSDGLLNLNVPYCGELLKKFQENTKTITTQLVLSWCSLPLPMDPGSGSGPGVNSSTLPRSLKYLNLNQALPPTQPGVDQLMAQLKESPALEQVHIFMAKMSKHHIDLTQLPTSLRTLSLSKLNLVTTGTGTGIKPVPSLTELTIERCNVTGIVDQLQEIFPNVKSVALFQIQKTAENQQFRLLNKILDNEEVESILVSGLVRDPKLMMSLSGDDLVSDLRSSSSDADADADQIAVERKLTSYNLAPTEQNFIISSNPRGGAGGAASSSDPGSGPGSGSGSGSRSAQSLTVDQLNYRRFELLAFNDMDEFDYYVKYDTGTKGEGGKLRAELFVTVTVIVVSFTFFFISFFF